MLDQHYFNRVRDYFNGNTRKAWEWFSKPNASFGGISPLSVIKNGGQQKVKHHIDGWMKRGNL